MNGFLWLGAACTVILVIAVLLDGLVDAFDALDLGPPWLSLPVIAAFGGAFGFVAGAAIDPLGPFAIALGVLAGLGLGAATVRFSSAFVHMPTDPTETAEDLLGSLGRVVESPAAGRYGAVLITRPTGPIKLAAIAEGPLAVGTEVVVVDVTSSTLVTVVPFDHDAIGPGVALEP